MFAVVKWCDDFAVMLALAEGLFHRLCKRCIKWSLEGGGHEPQLRHRCARFFLDLHHDFVLDMTDPHLDKLKVRGFKH